MIKRFTTESITRVRRSIILSSVALLAVSAQAQTQNTTTPPASKEDEEITVLSPFSIETSKDTGYKAANSLGGTKMNTAVKDLPFTIDVVTNDFIVDTGARSVDQALGYTAGIKQSGNAGGRTDYTMSIRGFPSSFFLRDGTAIYRAPDWTMIDRVEVIRGASAIVYGQTQPGGVINITTKKPDLTKQITSVEQTIGQWDNFVTKFDYNTPIVKNKLGIRLALSGTDAHGAREGYSKEGYVLFPSVTWRPLPSTQINVQYVHDYSSTRGLSPGLFPSYATSKKSPNYLNQNYEAYYNGLTPEQRTLYGLKPPTDGSIMNSHAGGPAEIFMNDPWKYNAAGGTGYWNADRQDFITSLEQVLVKDGEGMIRRSFLKAQYAKIADKVKSVLPLQSGEHAQGTRGSFINWADAAWQPATNNWSAQEWAFGSDYTPGNAGLGEAPQFGFYIDSNEANPGYYNMVGSDFYGPADITNPAAKGRIPYAGPNSFYWYAMAFMLKNTNEVITLDNSTDFEFGAHTKLRTLIGYEHSKQKYWDPGRKGNLPVMPGNSIEAKANNYVRQNDSWSSPAWGPAPGNGFTPLPNWGYGFSNSSGTNPQEQNPGTIWGSGDSRAYRGWSIYNAETGKRSLSHVKPESVLAMIEKYFYGQTQEITSDAFYMTGQLDLFDNKVSLLGALRYTKIEKEDYRVAGLNERGTPPYKPMVPEYPQKYDPLVPQVGIVYNINKKINVYASYAENYWYEWSRPTNKVGEVPPQNTAESIELGTKFDLVDGRISGTIALFETKMYNITYNDPTFDLTAYDRGQFPGHPDPLNPNPDPSTWIHEYGLDRFDGESLSRGVEVSLQLRPIDNLDTTLSYSYIKATLEEAAPWMEGLRLPGTPEHMANMWNKYTLNSIGGPLKGLQFGLGVQYNSPTWIGSPFSQAKLEASNYYWKTPVFIRFDAMVAFPFRALDVDWRLQLNVFNIAERVNWMPDKNFAPDGQGREFMCTISAKF